MVDPPDRAARPSSRQRRPAVVPLAAALRSRRPHRAVPVEARDGAVRVFLPPTPGFARFRALVAAVDAARVEAGIDVELEGYGPPSAPEAFRFSVTPDPGVLEVNIPPCRSAREHAALVDTVFEAAFRTGLHAEKYLVDGRMAGSGGGHHITLGGPSALDSPFVTRPDLLASLLTFLQHHPSLSYMFACLFVGPTSRLRGRRGPPRDAVRAGDRAGARLRRRNGRCPPPAWRSDQLFRTCSSI